METILKVHYLVKRLTIRLIKSNINWGSYYLNGITVVLYFSFILSHQIYYKFKHFQKFWWILIVYRKMCQFQVCTTTRSRLIFMFFVNIIISLWWSFKREIDTFCDNQSRSIKTFANFWIKSSFENIYIYMENITRLLDSLNNSVVLIRFDQMKFQSFHKIIYYQNVITCLKFFN